MADRQRKANATDAVTLCPVEGPTGAMVVLLDLTDPLTRSQANQLQTWLGDEIASSPRGTLLSVGVVSEDPSDWGARFAKCKPQTAEDGNPLIQNPSILGETYNDEFLLPLHETLEKMMQSETQNTSPIMESLQALVSGTPNFTTTRLRRLVIVSDMLQNSSVLSFYRSEGWEHFTETRAHERLAGNLDEVGVTLLRIPRTSANIGDPLKVDTFWARYFDSQGTSARFDVRNLGDL
ncbi:hypothetical protein [Thalassorhabdomicrobium marinisediminis]|nr:hypothetical protein [Thalassorhabdomicrobium marinisediminis]